MPDVVAGDLHLVRLVLDWREVARVAARHRLPAGADDGAVLHAALSELFAVCSERVRVPLHSFAMDDTVALSRGRPDLVFLLAYSSAGASDLVKSMGPAKGALLRQCESREMPILGSATRALFRSRLCPVVRTRQPGTRERPVDRQGKPRPRELDALLAAQSAENGATGAELMPFEHAGRVWSAREAVYTNWLEREVGRNGAATLEPGTRLERFRRSRFVRHRFSGNKRHSVVERPDAVLTGTLQVRSSEAFRALLRRGLGRHRAFGFGMLLLRPASGGPHGA